MDMNLRRRGISGRKAVSVGGGQRGKKWDNCDSITNRIYLKKRISAKWVDIERET